MPRLSVVRWQVPLVPAQRSSPPIRNRPFHYQVYRNITIIIHPQRPLVLTFCSPRPPRRRRMSVSTGQVQEMQIWPTDCCLVKQQVYLHLLPSTFIINTVLLRCIRQTFYVCDRKGSTHIYSHWSFRSYSFSGARWNTIHSRSLDSLKNQLKTLSPSVCVCVSCFPPCEWCLFFFLFFSLFLSMKLETNDLWNVYSMSSCCSSSLAQWCSISVRFFSFLSCK